jgi:hypothetical protein
LQLQATRAGAIASAAVTWRCQRHQLRPERNDRSAFEVDSAAVLASRPHDEGTGMVSRRRPTACYAPPRGRCCVLAADVAGVGGWRGEAPRDDSTPTCERRRDALLMVRVGPVIHSTAPQRILTR